MEKLLNSDTYVLVTDGACSGNPGPGGWACILFTPPDRVEEFSGSHEATTNNRMELLAVMEGIRRVPQGARAHVFTDSVYVIKGATQWIWGWRRRGWLNSQGEPVANQDLWEEWGRVSAGRKLDWSFVRGHSGHPGNERCDELAVAQTKGQYVTHYRGSRVAYPVPLPVAPSDQDLPNWEKKAQTKSAPAHYLSFVGGTLQRHASWPECQRAVHGRSGARFKKVQSRDEELAVCKQWGVSPLPEG